MLLITDSNTYLFEKIAKKHGIKINKIINLGPESEEAIFSEKSNEIHTLAFLIIAMSAILFLFQQSIKCRLL